MALRAKTPNPIDVHVGSRIRLARTMLHMSQEKLGESVGITFQQIQKYEKGTNRVGASRLQQIAQVLNRSVSFFFEGMSTDATAPESDDATALLHSKDGLRLIAAFAQVKDAEARRGLINAFIEAARLASAANVNLSAIDHLHQQPSAAPTTATH